MRRYELAEECGPDHLGVVAAIEASGIRAGASETFPFDKLAVPV